MHTDYRQLLERADLPTDGKHSQRMRRTHGVLLEVAGGDATKSYMHSRPAITTTYYVNAENSPPKNQVELLPEIEIGESKASVIIDAVVVEANGKRSGKARDKTGNQQTTRKFSVS